VVSRLALLREIFRTRTSKIVTGLLAFMAVYQFFCDQFGAPTLPNLWGMTGAAALPWWAWLLLAQLGFLYGLFEYVRHARHEPVAAPSEDDAPPSYGPAREGLNNTLLEIHKARRIAKMALAEPRGGYVGAVSRMESALTSTEKTFDIDVPEGVGDPKKDLHIWLDYFEAVWPFLENGNYENAKGKAVNFIVERQLQIRPR